MDKVVLSISACILVFIQAQRNYLMKKQMKKKYNCPFCEDFVTELREYWVFHLENDCPGPDEDWLRDVLK